MNLSVVIYGPSGCGKYENSSAIARTFGLPNIVDRPSPGNPIQRYDTLYLTEGPMQPLPDGVQCISYETLTELVKL